MTQVPPSFVVTHRPARAQLGGRSGRRLLNRYATISSTATAPAPVVIASPIVSMVHLGSRDPTPRPS